jgi:hypothetical protein
MPLTAKHGRKIYLCLIENSMGELLRCAILAICGYDRQWAGDSTTLQLGFHFTPA